MVRRRLLVVALFAVSMLDVGCCWRHCHCFRHRCHRAYLAAPVADCGCGTSMYAPGVPAGTPVIMGPGGAMPTALSTPSKMPNGPVITEQMPAPRPANIPSL